MASALSRSDTQINIVNTSNSDNIEPLVDVNELKIPAVCINNTVCTVNLQTPLVLEEICTKLRNAEYNPKRFRAVIIKLRNPKSTALLFGSGKMVVTGCRDELAAEIASKKYAKIISLLNKSARHSEMKIVNMTGTCDIGFPLRLESLVFDQQKFCSYEPELFPGLVYRMLQPKVVLLIFVSGKIVMTGARKKEDLIVALQKIVPILEQYKKASSTQLR